MTGISAMRSSRTPRPGPGVLLLGGADSLAEELYFFGGSEIAERGMATLILDTPGRGSSLRLKNIYARPDYEVPITAAIDYLSARPEVDPDRIGCVGVSMAGYTSRAGPRSRSGSRRLSCGARATTSLRTSMTGIRRSRARSNGSWARPMMPMRAPS